MILETTWCVVLTQRRHLVGTSLSTISLSRVDQLNICLNHAYLFTISDAPMYGDW